MLTLPIIHRNGTYKEALLLELITANNALFQAEQAPISTAPNGRDYYPVPGLLAKAEAEYLARLQKLTSIRTEIEELIDGIDAL